MRAESPRGVILGGFLCKICKNIFNLWLFCELKKHGFRAIIYTQRKGTPQTKEKENRKMTNAYTTLKNTIATATNEQLVSAFKLMTLTEDSTTEETLVYTALTSELEARGLVAFNDNTWEYELVA